ncbi:RAD9, HUS1, RAD1-interacting nuclear orphan protein 1 [Synchiropus picturatus]
MPRKTNKTEKPPLRFRERPRGGANLQNFPEVRAALNPKDYFAETQASSTCTSWVSPQFDTSLPVAPRGRRRRRCLSVVSVLDGSTQLTRKKTVCKYSSLSFKSRESNHSHQAKQKKNDTHVAASNNPLESGLVPSVQQDKSKGPLEKTGTSKPSSVAASSSMPLNESPALKTTQGVQVPSVSLCDQTNTNDARTVDPPPDLQTSIPEPVSVCTPHWLLIQPSTPPCSQPCDILVANTPERHYGLKVTWRRREDFMIFLKKRGHLSDSDVQKHD